MATLTQDSIRVYEIGDFNDLPVVASDIIYEGAIIGDNASGYARPLVAGDPFLGICERHADNSAGSAGDINVRSRVRGLIEMPVTGATGVGDVGSIVYAADDDTLTLTAGSNTLIGWVHRYVSSTTCVVRFDVYEALAKA